MRQVRDVYAKLKVKTHFTASAIRLQQERKPDAIQDLDHHIMTIQIELESLKKESDVSSTERRHKLEQELEQLSNDVAGLTEKWEIERSAIADIKKAKEDFEAARMELEKVQRNGDYAKASELRYSIIPRLEKRLPKEGSELSAQGGFEQMLVHDSVRSSAIENVVSRQTGIPVTKLMSGYVYENTHTSCCTALLPETIRMANDFDFPCREIDKLIKMEDTLRTSIRGQDEALVEVANAVRSQRAGLAGDSRPIASFMFMGPTVRLGVVADIHLFRY